jgi:HD-GYP domain-containing protein (c-di-GMP phosphodiesterase class II)
MKTKEQISEELNDLRKKVAALEKEWQQAVEEEAKYKVKRVGKKEAYYTFYQYYGNLRVYDDKEEFCSTDDKRATEFSYFHTKEEVEKVIKHFKAVLKARHLMKVLNGDWKPSSNNSFYRYFLFLDKGVPRISYDRNKDYSPWYFQTCASAEKFIELMGEQLYDLFEVM